MDMKKRSALAFLLLIAVTCVQAQKKILPLKPKADTAHKKMVLVTRLPQASSLIAVAPDIIFYEKPGYQGASAGFVKQADGKLVLPFPLKNVSFKVPEGKIVYIKTIFEFTSETAYFTSQPGINLENICGLRTDEKTMISVTFNGISTEIHNTDCMRFAGTVDIKVMEASTDNSTTGSVMQMVQTTGSRTVSGQVNYMIFNWGASQLTDRNYPTQYNNTGTIYNNNPVPELTTQAHDYFGHTQASYKASFYVGKTALQQGRISIWIKTDLTSAHKSCDLCDDFSSHVKMVAPASVSIPLNKSYSDGKIVNAAHPYFFAGPFTAKGSRDGYAITATSGTVKNFRVHFGVQGL
jgi:hypothetical protein